MNREKLIEAGIDYDEGVHRFAGKPEIYEKYLLKFFEGSLMDDLSDELKNNDFDKAFQTAHSLKGTAGNVSLNRFYSKICELVEMLRGENVKDTYMSAFLEAKKLYAVAEHAAKEL